MRVRLSKPARAELEAAVAYLRKENPRAAFSVQSAIEQAIESLTHFPHRGRESLTEGLREIVVRGTSYIVVYAVSDDGVIVLRIRHVSQDPAP